MTDDLPDGINEYVVTDAFLARLGEARTVTRPVDPDLRALQQVEQDPGDLAHVAHRVHVAPDLVA